MRQTRLEVTLSPEEKEKNSFRPICPKKKKKFFLKVNHFSLKVFRSNLSRGLSLKMVQNIIHFSLFFISERLKGSSFFNDEWSLGVGFLLYQKEEKNEKLVHIFIFHKR
jgi:hypothetical protein